MRTHAHIRTLARAHYLFPIQVHTNILFKVKYVLCTSNLYFSGQTPRYFQRLKRKTSLSDATALFLRKKRDSGYRIERTFTVTQFRRVARLYQLGCRYWNHNARMFNVLYLIKCRRGGRGVIMTFPDIISAISIKYSWFQFPNISWDFNLGDTSFRFARVPLFWCPNILLEGVL